MAASFEWSWVDDAILLVRRTGLMSVQEAEQLLKATEEATAAAPAVWGMVVDVRDAPPQADAVQSKLRDVVAMHVERGVSRVAIVTRGTVTGMQMKRMASEPGMFEVSRVVYFNDLDEAMADMRQALR
ncbi:MAG: hypothetical protein QOJ11_2771 [Frankiales bacterium]|nr:hypothetical protein [Frankiales bacterium]